MVDLGLMDQEYARKARFLAEVARSGRGSSLRNASFRPRSSQAHRAGCTGDEIAGAIRIVERAAAK